MSMIKQPKISVCIPTFNGEKYIKEQLDSILPQLGVCDEIIISDDRSTDSTIDIVMSLNDSRIKIYTHEKIDNPFKGPYKNIYYVYKNVEHALEYASGDYIFLSDQDDIWLPGKVARVVKEFEVGVECVLHNNSVMDDSYNITRASYFSRSKPSRNLIRFIILNFYQGASMAFTRRIKDLSLPFLDYLPISHDHRIACVAWTHGKKISYIQEPLLLYRRHGNNVSPSSEKSPNSLYFKISYRFNMLINYGKIKFMNR